MIYVAPQHKSHISKTLKENYVHSRSGIPSLPARNHIQKWNKTEALKF